MAFGFRFGLALAALVVDYDADWPIRDLRLSKKFVKNRLKEEEIPA
jgi:hypothetical protein